MNSEDKRLFRHLLLQSLVNTTSKLEIELRDNRDAYDWILLFHNCIEGLTRTIEEDLNP